MANTTEMTVTEQLKKVPPAVRPMLQAARRVVRDAAPGAEEIPYGSQPPRSSRYMWKIARYAVDGSNVVGIGTFPDHANLFFYRRRELDDATGLLDGPGQETRSR